MSYFLIIKSSVDQGEQTSDRHQTYSIYVKVCQEGEWLFQLVKSSHPEFLRLDECRCKKKKKKCACSFKWPEVAARLLNHYQSHSPPGLTSPVSEGIPRSARTPLIQTRSSGPERGKKSFLRSCAQIYNIPWRGNRPVSPFFSFSSLEKAKRHSCSTAACKKRT